MKATARAASVYRKSARRTAGLAESNGSLLPVLWRDSLHVTCGLTSCTPGSAPGPALGNEYGKTLPFYPCAIVRILYQVRAVRLLTSHELIAQRHITQDKVLVTIRYRWANSRCPRVRVPGEKFTTISVVNCTKMCLAAGLCPYPLGRYSAYPDP